MDRHNDQEFEKLLKRAKGQYQEEIEEEEKPSKTYTVEKHKGKGELRVVPRVGHRAKKTAEPFFIGGEMYFRNTVHMMVALYNKSKKKGARKFLKINDFEGGLIRYTSRSIQTVRDQPNLREWLMELSKHYFKAAFTFLDLKKLSDLKICLHHYELFTEADKHLHRYHEDRCSVNVRSFEEFFHLKDLNISMEDLKDKGLMWFWWKVSDKAQSHKINLPTSELQTWVEKKDIPKSWAQHEIADFQGPVQIFKAFNFSATSLKASMKDKTFLLKKSDWRTLQKLETKARDWVDPTLDIVEMLIGVEIW